MKHHTYIFMVFCGLLVSCVKWGSTENSHLMRQAQLLAEQMPDSALTLLDAMNTSGFSNAQKAEYHLLQIQAKSNAGLDLSAETDIFDVREFFIRKNDPQKAALACFFAAFIAAEQNQATKGMEYFQEALDFAKNTVNMELQGKILYNMGYLNYESGWNDDAIMWYRKALNILQRMDNQYQIEVYALNGIANAMMIMNKTDSAQYYYQLALDLAHLNEDVAMQLMLYNNMGVVHSEREQYDQAIYYSRQALQLAINDDNKIRIYLNCAHIFHETNNADSARYYLQMADTLVSQSDDIYVSLRFADVSYEIENAAGNYQKALEYHESYTKFYIEILKFPSL